MKQRTFLILLLNLLVAGGVVCVGTYLQAGSVPDLSAWLTAQRHTPALWVLDAAMLLTLVQTATLLRAWGGGQDRLTRLHQENRDQLEAMIRNTEQMDRTNSEQASRIEILQNELNARQEAFETEARRLTEQAFRALSGQVDANTRQLDAVNLALQYHRAQLQQLNQGMRILQSGIADPVSIARLTPAEIAAIRHELPEAPPPDASTETETECFPWSSPTQNAPSTVVTTVGHFEVDPEAFVTDGEDWSGANGPAPPAASEMISAPSQEAPYSAALATVSPIPPEKPRSPSSQESAASPEAPTAQPDQTAASPDPSSRRPVSLFSWRRRL